MNLQSAIQELSLENIEEVPKVINTALANIDPSVAI